MSVSVWVIAALIVLLALTVLTAAAVIGAEKRKSEKIKKDALSSAMHSAEATTEATNEKESLDTGNHSDDFCNGLDIMHKHAEHLK